MADPAMRLMVQIQGALARTNGKAIVAIIDPGRLRDAENARGGEHAIKAPGGFLDGGVEVQRDPSFPNLAEVYVDGRSLAP